eukprot:g5314.t1
MQGNQSQTKPAGGAGRRAQAAGPHATRTARAEEARRADLALARRFLFDWADMQRALPWWVLLMLGGGFALAEACEASGLSAGVGAALARLTHGWPPAALALAMSVGVAALTEVASNVATATMFLPIAAGVATRSGLHPLYMMVPVALACSFAFCLPVATPPNALVFSSGRLRVAEMVRAGLALNAAGLLWASVALNTYGVPLLRIRHMPAWAARVTNATRRL